MISIFLSLFMSAAIASSGFPRYERRCGGDGPKPLTDISPIFETSTSVLPVSKEVADFVYLQDKESIVYRGLDTKLGKLDLFSGLTKWMGNIDLPISRLVDRNENYLLARDKGAIFDMTTEKGWKIFSNKSLQHLFWQDDTLYSLESDAKPGGPAPQNFIVQKYFAKTGGTASSCVLGLQPSSNVVLAEGHHFPYVFFMSSRKAVLGHKVSFYKFHVDTCKIEEYYYNDPFPGPATKLVRYEPMDATLIRVHHHTENMMWDFDGRCTFFNIGDAEVLPLRDDTAVVGLWSKKQGLNLAYLNQEKRARILEKLPVTNVVPSDLALAPNAAKLFYRPVLDPTVEAQPLLRVDLITKVLDEH